MPLRRISLGVTTALLMAVLPSASSAQDASRPIAASALRDQAGALIGSVTFVRTDGGTQVRADLWSMTPGFHGFHIHAVGTCTDDFSSAEGHWNRAGTSHAHHDGDMPALYVKADGTATLRFESDRFSVAELLHEDGSAVIVHALPDNLGHIPTRYATEPDATTLNTGGAGSRVACGAIE